MISCALKRLAVDKKAEKVRFWGKILTQTKDYFIAQGFTKFTCNDEPTGDMEKLKEGANYHVYWVTQNICILWVYGSIGQVDGTSFCYARAGPMLEVHQEDTDWGVEQASCVFSSFHAD